MSVLCGMLQQECELIWRWIVPWYWIWHSGLCSGITCQHRCCRLQVALASFAFLFSEFVQYSQSQVSNIGELERRWGPPLVRLQTD
jgi:hypothetical protein